MKKELILASGSPRRREILESAGYKFSVISPDADEGKWNSSPADLAEENSSLKARAALLVCSGVIICADTIVCADNKILGKPETPEEAAKMLSFLSGRDHSVITGFTVTDGEKTITSHETTVVSMREIQKDEIDAYVASGDPMDKAGAYGIQGAAGMFVSKIHGDYYNVVGLPISRISEILRREFSIPAFQK